MSAFLSIKNLSKRYGNGPLVISGLTHYFKKGEGTGLIGANGSGKTTFLRLLSVTSFPTEGTILFQDKSIHDAPHQFLAQTGIVIDTTELPSFLSAGELLEWTLRARGKWKEEESEEEIARIFESLLFDERHNNLIGTYSSGMLQKTMLACCLAVRPQILLLDEPFRALDQESQQALTSLLIAFKQERGTLIISSHLKDSLEPLCDHYLSFPILKPADNVKKIVQ